MDASFRLLLVRHGTTDANVEGRFLGQTDVPLNATGREEAAAVAERLRRTRFDAVVTSDLLRARQTAEAIAGGAPVVLEPRLREIHLGDLDGALTIDVRRGHPELMARWQASPADCRMPGPGAETLAEVQARAWSGLEALRAAHPGGQVAVVSHTFTLLAIVCRALELDLARFRLIHLDRASITELHWRRYGPTLVRLNDTAHLTA